jgi:hypothetical protein
MTRPSAPSWLRRSRKSVNSGSGYEVICVGDPETWDEAIRTNTWVFGPGRAE